MHEHTDWLTHRKTDGHKKERRSKTSTVLSMLVPQILWSPRVSVLSTRCEECHPKGIIVAT